MAGLWEWIWSVMGVCLGNTLWLSGLMFLGIGVWGLRVKKESVLKLVGVMGFATGGKPSGFALKLKGLVEPEERTKSFGGMMLGLGIIILVIGCSLVSSCAG